MVEAVLIDNRAADIANRGMPRVQEWSFCGIRRRTNGRVDLWCLKELDTDFIYMVLFIVAISALILSYAAVQS